MKNVLIPTNFSAESRYALEYVLEFLQYAKVPSRILLVNTYIVQLDGDPQELLSLNDALKAKSRAMLREEVAWARAHCSNPLVTIDSTSHMGSLNNVILNLLRREKIDLVAMGKANGNHVEQVATLLKQQNCPLLITYRPQTLEIQEA